MTLLDAQNALYDFLSKNDIFDLEKDLKGLLLNNLQIIPVLDSEIEEYKQIFRAAIKQGYEKLLVEFTPNQWILVKPLSSFTQMIELSSALCKEVSRVTNCDILNITNRDVEDAFIVLCQEINKNKTNDE